MRILLDENLPHDLRHALVGHDVATVAYLRWQGLGNGRLLARAAAEGFDVLLTKDAGFEHQHDAERLPVAVLIVRAATNDLEDIEPLVPRILIALANLAPRTVVRVD